MISKTKSIFLLLVLSFSPFLSASGQQQNSADLQVLPAKTLAKTINDLNLPELDVNSALSKAEILQRVNQGIDAINNILGFTLSKLDLTPQEMNSIENFLPLVDPYNRMVRAAHNFNEDNIDSVREMYVSALAFAGDTVAWKGKIAFRFAYKATGLLTDALQLSHLKSLCGSGCLKLTMSEIHWFIRNNAEELLGEWERITPILENQSTCFIVTATYGSDLTSEVQFLRKFRDQKFLTTFSGSSFISLFNSFYYSWSPQVADTIRDREGLKSAVRVLISPLLWTLAFSSAVYDFLSADEEVAASTTIFVNTFLLGILYLTIPMLLIKSVFKSKFGKKSAISFKIALTCSLVAYGMVLFGTSINSTELLSAEVASLVVSSGFAGSMLGSLTVNATLRFLYRIRKVDW